MSLGSSLRAGESEDVARPVTYLSHFDQEFILREPPAAEVDGTLQIKRIHPLRKPLHLIGGFFKLDELGSEKDFQALWAAYGRELFDYTIKQSIRNVGTIDFALGKDINTLRVVGDQVYDNTKMYEPVMSTKDKRTLPSPTWPSPKRVKTAPAPLSFLPITSSSSRGSSPTLAGIFRPPPSLLLPSTNIPDSSASGRLISEDSASNSGSSSGSSNTCRPDVWVKVVANILQQTFALVTMITEVKVHPIHPSLESPRRDKAREAFTQTILYLVATWEICGTWLGSWIVNSKFGRMCVMGREGCNGLDSELPPDLNPESEVVVAVEAPAEQVNKLRSIKLSALLESSVNLFDILPHDIFKGYKDDGMPQVDENDELDFDGAAVNLITSVFIIAVELAASIPFGQPLQRLPGPSASFQKDCKAILDRSLYFQPDSKDDEQLVVVNRRKLKVDAIPPGQTSPALGAVPQGIFPSERPTDLAVSVDDNTTESTSAYDGETEKLQGRFIGRLGDDHKSEGDGGTDAERRGGDAGYDGGGTESANEMSGELGKGDTINGQSQTSLAAVGSNSTQELIDPTVPEVPFDLIGRWLSSARDSEDMESVGSGGGDEEDFPEARPAWLSTVRIVFVSPNTMTEMICKRCEP